MKHLHVSSFVIVTLCVILLAPSAFAQTSPEPSGWYSGDMHVHRSCGGSPESVSTMFSRMTPQKLSAISLLADMGNAEVQNATTDLPLVNGKDDPISTSGQILHWDTEWHWDATYGQYAHQALGGHIVALGLSNAKQIWNESTFPILDWAHQQNGIAGFAHMQYLDNGFPTGLTCCTPIEYPVEVALGSADFISEDVDDVNSGFSMNPENFTQAYYRLLNNGFRPGFAAGTDYPCNSSRPLGSLLTYVQVAGGQMSYRNWIDGIAKGRTVVSRNGHNEFLNLTVNGTATPGDEIALANSGSVQVTVQWTASTNFSGTIELVQNGVVIASKQASAGPGAPASLTTSANFTKSGWLAARRMGGGEHYVHTAAVFVMVNNAPIRASAPDAQFYVDWMNGLLQNTSPGGQWNSFFPTSLSAAQSRYQAAKDLYQQIASEATGSAPTLNSIAVSPANQTIATGAAQVFTASGTYSNATTLNMTGQARWISSNPTVATINSRGVASALNPGTTTISASVGSVTGGTTLTVAINPIVITTQSLAGGIVGVAYSDTLAASGGTQPYAWSIISGSLPSGLSLNSDMGSITGTPTTAGTFNFTAQASDSSSPQRTATKALNIVISGSVGGNCPCTIWPITAQPGVADSGPDSPVELGVKFRSDMNGFITGIRFYKGAGNTGTHVGNLWSSSGARLATATFAGETTTGWQQVNFASPVAITANTTYVASYFAPNGHYADDLGYFGNAVDRAPLHALADGTDGASGVYTYGSTSSFPSLGWQSSNYWVDVVFTTSNGPDTTSPAVTSASPANGTTGVNPATTVVVTFSEALNSTTINSNTFQLLAPGSTPVAASVTYSGTNLTATLTPTATLTTSTSYTAVVTGGSSGVKDLAGNAMGANVTWSFTTAAAPPPPGLCPCTVWSLTTVPAAADGGDATAGEYGFRFRSDVNGSITGIRFYKASTNTGAHSAHLWTNAGTLIGTASFANESASGWQEADFSAPVAIAANTTYVASYFAPNGHYSANANYFTSNIDSAPLHALQDASNGANGVYNYGATSAFPNSTFQSTNYWADVVFVPTNSNTPPTVTSVKPPKNSSGTAIGGTVSATFSEPLTGSSVSGATFFLVDAGGNQVSATVTYDSSTATAVLTPTAQLNTLATYTAIVKGGANGIKDFNGNALASDFVWSFTTGTVPPPPNAGPGGPILVISSAANPFTQYFSEILSTEGFNEFAVKDISSVSVSTLANYDVVILGDMSLTSAQVSMLSTWVTGGGNLIAMHPDKQLAGMLGLTPSSSTLSNAYLLVNTSSGPGVGIVGQTMQFHGGADLYTLNGATRLATLYTNATTPTSSPALSLANFGAGQAAAFTYDLARSVVYTRQGNPAWSGQKRDGQDGPIRSDDLFFGAASFDPQPDWVNLNKVSIPQADEQQRLLANLILQMQQRIKPVPRFWYFPSGFKAVVIMTGDDHANGGTAGRFDTYMADSPSGCSLADWQCVRATSYIYPTTPISPAQAASYVAQGFEVALHVTTDCADWTPASLESYYASELLDFAQQFPNLPVPRTNRTHCIAWSDYDTQPQVELSHGIRLDTNYYYWPPTWINDQPGLFTGSGMPMRFTDRNGNLIDEYQATTQMTDESGQSYPFTIDTLLDNAVGSQGFYGAFTANMHHDSVQSDGADAIIASAQARGVPVVSAQQMLTWLDGRNNSSFGSLTWNSGTLSFNISVAAGGRNLQAMLPINFPSGSLTSINRNGTSVIFSTQTIKGVQYGVFNAIAGSYQATYGGTIPSVVLSSISVNPPSVVGGSNSTGTVTLNGTAPSSGAVVALSSNNTAVAQVPASVTVPAGAISATFSITTSTVSSSTSVTITGVYGTTATANLGLTPTPVTASSVTLNPGNVIGGNPSTGTVTISGAAPIGGALVTLSSSNSTAATVPVSVTVPVGSTSTTFAITTSGVAANTSSIIAATLGTTANATLTITSAVVSSLTLSPASVTGGANSTATVRLNGVAPAGGALVTLSSANTSVATVPGSVTIPAGSTATTFTIATSAVSTTATSVITAIYGANAIATLTVNPILISSVSLSPTSVVGGNNSTATVRLNGVAPTGGAVVSLNSSNTIAATVPASITVPAGSSSSTFIVTSLGVASSTTSVITATFRASATATLTVTAATLSSVTRTPSSVIGGNNSTGTVTLTGSAPPTGAVVALSSSNTAAVQVPVSVAIGAGSRTATFTITTGGVASQTTSTITASYSGVNRTTTLTVTIAALSTLGLNPSTVKGGTSSTATLTLNGAAPPSGVAVSITSSNTSVAQVPGSVIIPAGSKSATFTVTTSPVTGTKNPRISGTLRLNTRSATLTVQ